MQSRLFVAVCACFLCLCSAISVISVNAQEGEETYSISLTKTAENQGDKTIREVDDKKVLAQEYTIQDGDHVWQLLRERGLLEKKNLAEILTTLKKLNKSLQNLDLIHPGEKIVIPLRIAPATGAPAEEETVKIAELKDIDFRSYTVQKDDHLVKVIRGMYNIPEDDLYGDYLKLVRQVNPSVKSLNKIYPGQTIRLPIYSPEVVRVPIEEATPARRSESSKKEAVPDTGPNPVGYDLGVIFNEIGEEWVDRGEHFIPLKTGGQINLKASSFPLIDMKNGRRVIVDLDSKLPSKMSGLIESSWDNYRVIRLTRADQLRTALGKVIEGCNYTKVFKKEEPLEIGKFIPLRITADYIISWQKPRSDGITSVAIYLKAGNEPDTPKIIKDYLAGLGVKVIDYPAQDNTSDSWTSKVEILKAQNDPAGLIKTFFGLVGQSFSEEAQIPVYESRKDEIQMSVKADFAFEAGGKEAVIDLTGLEPDVVALLAERHYRTLLVADEKDPIRLLAKTCKFLGRPCQPGPLQFKARSGNGPNNIILTLPGIRFTDQGGDEILATTLTLPDEINAFLYHQGYRVLFVGG